jgi:hypothetical protein
MQLTPKRRPYEDDPIYWERIVPAVLSPDKLALAMAGLVPVFNMTAEEYRAMFCPEAK